MQEFLPDIIKLLMILAVVLVHIYSRKITKSMVVFFTIISFVLIIETFRSV
ncbi:putative membrane protein [Campylobacter sp. CCUG 57310]|nr:putative membrane protein [Campylobacter sp. CCUG 57310]